MAGVAGRLGASIAAIMIGAEVLVSKYGQGTCFGRAVVSEPYSSAYLGLMFACFAGAMALGAVSIMRMEHKAWGVFAMVASAAVFFRPI
jgi:hypothetical protein